MPSTEEAPAFAIICAERDRAPQANARPSPRPPREGVNGRDAPVQAGPQGPYLLSERRDGRGVTRQGRSEAQDARSALTRRPSRSYPTDAARWAHRSIRAQPTHSCLRRAPSICSTSVKALISAWRRSIAFWRSAIACAMALMATEITGRAAQMSNSLGWMPVVEGNPRVRFMPSPWWAHHRDRVVPRRRVQGRDAPLAPPLAGAPGLSLVPHGRS